MPSKYDRLADHLATYGDVDAITLTFAEIEAIVGPLPVGARYQSDWWGTSPLGRYVHAHAHGWWRAGYVADRPDFAAQTVTFRRVAS